MRTRAPKTNASGTSDLTPPMVGHPSGQRGGNATPRGPLAQLLSRTGDGSSASAHAVALRRTSSSGTTLGSQSFLQLQQRYGNRYVQRVLATSKQGKGHGEVASEVEGAIQRTRGGGQALDSTARTQMESAFGTDFSGVRVHTGTEADTLNRALAARAFTTGQDVFFRQGQYSPGTSAGQELLAHELTHVVQQNGGRVHGKLTVSQPGDVHEQEADEVAKAVTRKLHRQTTEEEEKEQAQTKADDGVVRRQVTDEEEELAQAKLEAGTIRRQNDAETEEEEPLQTKTGDVSIQRQGERRSVLGDGRGICAGRQE